MKTFQTAPRDEPSEPWACPSCGSASESRTIRSEGFAFARCARCGLWRQQPLPDPGAVRLRYDHEYLDYELERQLDFRDLELRSLADVGFPVEARRPGGDAGRRALLDVGCATGALAAALRERGWDARGVEVSPVMAARGRADYGLDIFAGTLEEARFPVASFDAVHASHLIEHLHDPASFLAECSRILAPGGELVLTTPNVRSFQFMLRRGAWRSAIRDHLVLFSDRTLAALAADAGFTLVRSVTWGGWPVGARPAWLKKPLDAAAKRLGTGDVMCLRFRKGGAAEAASLAPGSDRR
ncbi:MAG: class I SAM-dependent methyltransferase [Spirochaetales bacterium]|nr:class I SAM-dependent methyltransferase [Spirochaetales bacterium]